MEEEVALLASHDADPVNRWVCAQKAFTNAILALAGSVRARRRLRLPAPLTRIVRHLLEDRRNDPGLVALAIAPPDPAYVAALEPEIDADGVATASDFLQRALASALRQQFEKLCEHEISIAA